MSHLLQLPTEILLQIYHSLSDIDDILRLSCSCRRTHAVLNPVAHRLSVFRSVVCGADHHKHDLRLYRLREAQDCSTLVFPGPSSLPSSRNSLPRSPRGSDSGSCTHTIRIPDHEVWEVVCRWHAMKLLYDLYNDRAIQLCYFLSIPLYSASDEFEEFADNVANEGILPMPSCGTENVCQPDTARKQRAYQRFYKALTAHWVAVESLCLTRITDFETTEQRNRHLDMVWDIWTNNPDRTLLEKLEVLEVTGFVWGFLGRKIFPAFDAPSKWLTGGGEDLLNYMDDQYSQHSNWLHFTREVAQCLRPPHIIELLLLNTWSTESTWCSQGPIYLHELGFAQTGAVRQVNEMNQTDDFFPLTVLEDDVVNELTGSKALVAQSPELCQLKWDMYRCEKWVFESRTKIFLLEPTPEKIYDSIFG
ncbi:unnamed protein product [Penicillium salamii]|uniref:F-box domain-containing protein n=1 Tax=Penicillium salamii TaxID=1612424 RepID=A0A9W4IF77_9EURO|nr:unnamed protein product [Penicillium salamii]CAG7977937.1 unnamed protein product [Penicillium salamii]CAG8016194.1 unnamed protein product [Penicillium salamii]CAG8063463.1 unnamed protein product [Penicillium salamii]CAG8295291.1 unnamed protein product [Penicillium salamii]